MAEIKDKFVTVESIEALHDYNKTIIRKGDNGCPYVENNLYLGNGLIFNANSTAIYGMNADGEKIQAFNPQNESGNIVLGYGSYSNAKGTTNIYGDIVKFATNNGVEFEGENARIYNNGHEEIINFKNDNGNFILGKGLYDYGLENTVDDAQKNMNLYGNWISFTTNKGVEFNGANAAIYNDDKVEVINFKNNDGNMVIGKGLYDTGSGQTNIYGGKAVNIKSRGGVVTIDGREYGYNKRIFDGVKYMGKVNNAIQKITLTDKISNQPHGVVFMWSLYDIDKGVAKDTNWHYHFVPKRHLVNHAGEGINFNFALTLFGTVAGKYLYVKDTEIIGAESNTASGIGATGIKYNNKKFVLRAVIGV